MSLIPQCNQFTTMATIMNGMDTIPSHCDKATITVSVAMMTKLLDWANSMATPEDIYKVVENMTSLNLSGVIDLDSWSGIVPDTDEEEIVEKPNEEEIIAVSDEVEDGIENTEDAEAQSLITGLFDDSEKEGQEALRKYQAKFNIVPEEPTIEEPVIDTGLTPELEDEINQIIAIANH